jgi:hypothetical protein
MMKINPLRRTDSSDIEAFRLWLVPRLRLQTSCLRFASLG